MRAQAIILFGNLSAFGDGPSKQPFLEQIHSNFVSLLLHLNDPEDEVKKVYSKTCAKRPLSKRQKICFQDQLSLNAGQKFCRMHQGEHSAILLTFVKLSFVIKIFVLSMSGRFT